MPLTRESIKQTIAAVLVELERPPYHLSQPVLARIQHYSNTCNIQLMDSGDHSRPARIVETIEATPEGGVTIHPSLYIIRDGNPLFLQSVLFHELMHLFSIGYCLCCSPQKDRYYHRSGLDSYWIHIPHQVDCVSNYFILNEQFNDAIAAYLFAACHNDYYIANSRFARLSFFSYLNDRLAQTKVTKEHLVGAYLAYEDELLLKVLLSQANETLDNLEKRLVECCRQDSKLQ